MLSQVTRHASQIVCSILLMLIGGQSVSAQTQTLGPSAIVAVASYERAMADVEFVGRLLGQSGARANVEQLLTTTPAAPVLKMIDRTKPWGAAFFENGSQPVPVVMIPVETLDGIEQAVAAVPGATIEGSGQEFTLSVQGQQIFLRQQQGYAFAAQQRSLLQSASVTWIQKLVELTKQADIALHFDQAQVPDKYRELALARFKTSYQKKLARRSDETDRQYQIRKAVTDHVTQAVDSLVDGCEAVTLNFVLDEEKKRIYVDCDIQARPGTELEQRYSQFAARPTRFGKFLRDRNAAVIVRATAALEDPATKELLVSLFAGAGKSLQEAAENDPNLSQSDREILRQTGQAFVDSLSATVEQGELDGAVAFYGPDTTVVSAFRLECAEQLAEQLGHFVQSELPSTTADFELTTVQIGEIEALRIRTDVPEHSNLRTWRGKTIHVLWAIADGVAYLAAGKHPEKYLGAAIQRSADDGQLATPFQAKISLGKVFRGEVSRDPLEARMQQFLSRLFHDEWIRISAVGKNGKLRTRLELDPDLLKLWSRVLAMGNMLEPTAR